MKSKDTRVLDILVFIPCNIPLEYKQHVIYFTTFELVEGVEINAFLENIKTYVSDIVKSYKDTIIWLFGKLRNVIIITSNSIFLERMCCRRIEWSTDCGSLLLWNDVFILFLSCICSNQTQRGSKGYL